MYTIKEWDDINVTHFFIYIYFILLYNIKITFNNPMTMNRIMVDPINLPISSEFVKFFSIHSIPIVQEDPQVIHYVGDDPREPIRLCKEFSPDIIVIHDERAVSSRIYKYAYIVDLTNDINIGSTIRTNVPHLAELYYRRLGLTRDIIDDTVTIHNQQKSSILDKIKSFMLWE